jgi:hypothetical protein
MEENEELIIKSFTPLQEQLIELMNNNDIDEGLGDTALIAFSTDEALQKAIDWLKEHPDFTNMDLSKIIGKFGVESENFTTHIEIVDDDEETEE